MWDSLPNSESWQVRFSFLCVARQEYWGLTIMWSNSSNVVLSLPSPLLNIQSVLLWRWLTSCAWTRNRTSWFLRRWLVWQRWTILTSLDSLRYVHQVPVIIYTVLTFFFFFCYGQIIESYESIHLVMEYADQGTLHSKVTTEGPLTEDQARHTFVQLVSAIDYMVGKLKPMSRATYSPVW